MQKRSLGRGLSELLSSVGQVATRGIIDIELDLIEPNPYQPRREFAEEELAELASSIRVHGVLQPLLVREGGERYQLIAGERRLRASRKVGLITVPCLVYSVDDLQLLMLALIENLQREDLNAVEQARAYRQLMEQFGMTQEDVADRVGKSRPAVANCVRLLSLPNEVLEAIAGGTLSEGHARALLGLRDQPARLYDICQQVMNEGLNVRQTEELARKSSAVTSSPSDERRTKLMGMTHQVSDPYVERMGNRIQEALATKVSVTWALNGTGTIVIRYNDMEELNRIADHIAPLGEPF